MANLLARSCNQFNQRVITELKKGIGIIPCHKKRIKPISIKEYNENLKLILKVSSISNIPEELRIKAHKNKKPLYTTVYNQNTIMLFLAGYMPTKSHAKRQRVNRILMRAWIQQGHRGKPTDSNCKERRLKRLNYKYARKFILEEVN